MTVRVLRVLAALLLVAAVALLWPQRLGGSTTLVVTRGISMKPAMIAGDLAILRTADSYGVGDVVGYRSPKLKTIVLHRIVEQTPSGYVFKGDNNNFKDPEVVKPDWIVGSLSLHVPKAGKGLLWIAQPVHLMLLLGGLGLLFLDRDKDKKQAASKAPTEIVLAAPPLIPAHLAQLRLADSAQLDALGETVFIDPDGRRLVITASAVLWFEPEAEPARLRLLPAPGKHQAPSRFRRRVA